MGYGTTSGDFPSLSNDDWRTRHPLRCNDGTGSAPLPDRCGTVFARVSNNNLGMDRTVSAGTQVRARTREARRRSVPTIRFRVGPPARLPQVEAGGKTMVCGPAPVPRDPLTPQNFWRVRKISWPRGCRRCALRGRALSRRFGVMSDLHQDFAMKARPDDMVHLRLPSDLRATVERRAGRNQRTLSGELRFLICIGLETLAAGPSHSEA
jgi:hypothetical protein